jgi:hypothetical protein
MPSGSANQNQFQNAGQNGSFYLNEVANQSSTFFVLLLAIILLIALLISEGRNRALMERFMLYQREKAGQVKIE